MAGNKKRKGLGSLGVDVLLSTPAAAVPATTTANDSSGVGGLNYVSVDLIDRSPYQPRQHIAAEGLQELADSIRVQGLITSFI